MHLSNLLLYFVEVCVDVCTVAIVFVCRCIFSVALILCLSFQFFVVESASAKSVAFKEFEVTGSSYNPVGDV